MRHFRPLRDPKKAKKKQMIPALAGSLNACIHAGYESSCGVSGFVFTDALCPYEAANVEGRRDSYDHFKILS